MMRMERRSLCLALIAALLVSVGPGGVASALAASFGGRAFSAFVNLPSLGAGPVYIADTGALSSDGGWAGATLPGTAAPGVLSAETLVAATSGALTDMAGDQVNSSTSLANVVILPGQLAQVSASFVRAQADSTDVGLSGYSEVDNLTFSGFPIQVTGLPNQRVSLPGLATLVINEQTTTAQGIVVNALHLILATGEEVIVSSASSAIYQ
jgi:hypothetical protein